jgi:predicted molibdopterin-dependent oxidoreductase YjgC
MVRRVIPPLGQSRTDADIIMELSGRLGYAMDYESPAEIMEEISLLAPIYGGMQHDRLEESSWGLQWPCWDRSHPGTPFLHKYYFTRGKGRFIPAEHVPPAELPDDDYPFLLITGRIYHQYHTGTMTRRSALLSREAGEALLQLHPEDGRRLGVRSGDLVRMRSRRGEVRVKAQLTEAVKAGEVYTTFHFSEMPVNLLTSSARDHDSQCPEYKICAVHLAKV